MSTDHPLSVEEFVAMAEESEEDISGDDQIPLSARRAAKRSRGGANQPAQQVDADDVEDEPSWVCLSITWKPSKKRGTDAIGKAELDTLKLVELKKLVKELESKTFPQWKADGVLEWAIFRIERGDKKKGLHGQSGLMVSKPAGYDQKQLYELWKAKCIAAIASAGITTLQWEWPFGKGIKVHDDPDDLIGYCEVKDVGKIWSERAMIGISENKLRDCVKRCVGRRGGADGQGADKLPSRPGES
jgi:hypothetical protein